MVNSDRLFMMRALRLASNASPDIKLNPPVGCIIVHQERIIGEGYHHSYGDDHAEVIAIKSVQQEDKNLFPECTVYVTLEPCSHFGKTPPCAHLLAEKQFQRIVIGCKDPYSKVAGRGIEYLRKHGTDVEVPFMQEEAAHLIHRFSTHLKYKKPYITVKWAQSRDSFIGKRGKQIPISGKSAQFLVHKWRAQHQAIMVGSGTVLVDNPMLDNRLVAGDSPDRVILDRRQRLNGDENVFREDGKNIYYFTSNGKNSHLPSHVNQLSVEEENKFLQSVFTALYKREVASIFIEGGATIHRAIINADLYDEIRIIRNKKLLKNGIKAPRIIGNVRNSYTMSEDRIIIL